MFSNNNIHLIVVNGKKFMDLFINSSFLFKEQDIRGRSHDPGNRAGPLSGINFYCVDMVAPSAWWKTRVAGSGSG